MKKLFRLFVFFIFQALVFAPHAQADQIFAHDDRLFLKCENTTECLNLCKTDSCEIAKLTCESCARSSDQAMLAVFRSFDSIYQREATPLSSTALHAWSLQNIGRTLAIAADSPLDIFSDPFEQTEVDRLQNSFSQVCGVSGRHVILARVTQNIEPQKILCEQSPDKWTAYTVQFHADYYKSQP